MPNLHSCNPAVFSDALNDRGEPFRVGERFRYLTRDRPAGVAWAGETGEKRR
jgi:hypothetical protein